MPGRFIHSADLAGLAATVGVTVPQVRSFIGTQQANGNIAAVSSYINSHPGTTLADIEANAVPGTPLDPTVALNIVKLLVFVGQVDEF